MTTTKSQSGYNIQRPDDAIGFAAGAVAGLYRPWLLGALLACQAAMLLAFHISTSWHSAPDSALYMGLARSLAEGEGYTFNGEFHAMVPPLFPLALAGVMRVFGSSFLALNVFQIVLAMACTPAIFLLMRQLYGRDLALLAAGAFALNFVQWTVASIVMSDLLFVLLATLGMSATAWAAGNGQARWAGVALAGLGIAAASMTRSNGFVIVPGAALAVWLGWRDRPAAVRLAGAILLAAIALAPVVLWQRYAAAHVTGDPLTYLSTSHLSKPLGLMLMGMAGNFFDKVLTIASNLMVGFNDVPPGLNAILPAVIVIGCVAAMRRREPMLPISLVCMVGVLMMVSGVKSRYFLFVYPGMVVLFLAGAVTIGRWAARGRANAPRQVLRGALVFLAVAGAINIGHSIARGVEYRNGEVAGGARVARDQDWFTAARYIRNHGQAGREPLALTSQPRLLFYLARIRGLGLTRGGADLSDQVYQDMTRRRRPDWLVGDVKERSTARAVGALRAIGVHLTPVTDAQLTGALKMWRISPPPAPESAPDVRP